MSELFKKNCSVLAEWYAGNCERELQMNTCEGWLNADDYEQRLNSYEYRLKPNTIMVNGIEVPEPVRIMPNRGDTVWFTDTWDKNGYWQALFDNTESMQRMFDRGLMHITEEAAKQHFEALITPSKVQS